MVDGMREGARFAIHLAVFIGCYALIFGIAYLVQRAKRNSPRWQQRSVRQRRLLARLPGIVIAMALYGLCIFLIPV